MEISIFVKANDTKTTYAEVFSWKLYDFSSVEQILAEFFKHPNKHDFPTKS